MKKILLSALALTVSLFLVSCAGEQKKAEPSKPDIIEEGWVSGDEFRVKAPGETELASADHEALKKASEAAAVKKDLSGYKGVWVFAEQKKGKVQSVSFELVGKARELADKLNTTVSAVLLGSGVEMGAQELIASPLLDQVFGVRFERLRTADGWMLRVLS